MGKKSGRGLAPIAASSLGSPIRRAARVTARQYAWSGIVTRVLLPRLDLLRTPDAVTPSSGRTTERVAPGGVDGPGEHPGGFA